MYRGLSFAAPYSDEAGALSGKSSDKL